MDGWMNQAYSRLSTTHGRITDCKLLVCVLQNDGRCGTFVLAYNARDTSTWHGPPCNCQACLLCSLKLAQNFISN